MKRIPNEPVFVFTTATSVQVWTLADYLRFCALEQAWRRKELFEELFEGRSWMDVSIVAYDSGKALGLIPDLYDVEDEDGNVRTDDGSFERAVVNGVPFVRWPFDLRLQHAGDYEEYPGTLTWIWVPDTEQDIPDIRPWKWTDEGLGITLRLPGE